MTKVIQYFSNQPKSHLIALGFVLVVLVGVFHYLTGPELFVSIFYLIPILLVSWFTETWGGIVMSIVSALSGDRDQRTTDIFVANNNLIGKPIRTCFRPMFVGR